MIRFFARARLVLFAGAALLLLPRPVLAAEATTGVLSGVVRDDVGMPLGAARITAASPSGRYATQSDAAGRFVIVGIAPDTYVVSVEKANFASNSQAGIVVLPGRNETLAIRLASALHTIGVVRASANAFRIGEPSDTFVVSGADARAHAPTTASAGLGAYGEGTVQGAVANVPGVDLDPFANAILRGGKVGDAIFDYDSVPIPQGLIVEPGGNVAGAQLPTTGIASTSVTLAGYAAQSDNALGGVIDQIPAVGTYPGRSTVEFANGLGSRLQYANAEILGATPDLRLRYAVASTVASQDFSYGDGTTFYPAEAGTYGLAITNRAQYSIESNVHFRLGPRDDLAFLGLVGQATYNQYGTPFTGETVGALSGVDANGTPVLYPSALPQAALVHFASGVRGSYDVVKLEWLHSGAHVLSRVQLYQSQDGSSAGGPYWDENGFPNGTFSLAENGGARQTGLNYDADVFAPRHHVRYGAEYRIGTSFLDQVVPTAGEFISSKPTLDTYLTYAGDTWNATNRLDLTGTVRVTGTHVKPSFGTMYDVGAIDPHLGAAYRVGSLLALRFDFDRTTVAPAPLEADRTTLSAGANGRPAAPFAPLAAESASDFTYAIDGGGSTPFRLTYYEKLEHNLIDVLPFDYHSALASGVTPAGVGIPTNVGQLRVNGFEVNVRHGGFRLSADLSRALSSSASQFAYNDLNAPAIAAGHLFPVAYQPDFTSTFSYEFMVDRRRLRITPALSYESGYPYGNGRMVYTFDASGKPLRVNNDNYVDPGANYYFLADPSRPFDAATNPYIGNLGTNEGNDPNTLRSPPQTTIDLHVERDFSPRLTAVLDVANLLGDATPTAYQQNPYLIGPPGYRGGNPLYGTAYQQIVGGTRPYVLGNGVPTNDGVTQTVPWTYGTAGYVPQSYPLARTVEVRVRYRL